jgi:pimeloyl-ACP methyl ester carboxylesterase
VAGFSMGGTGALEYASRHPNLFVAVGGFSGLAHTTEPEDPYEGAVTEPQPGTGSPGPAYGGHAPRPYRTPDDANSGCNNSSNQWGDRVNDAVIWHGHNPADLASNLRGTKVYVGNGNGTPCDPLDPLDRPTIVEPGEAATLVMNQDFAAAARAAHVDVTTNFYGCGVHTMRYAERNLHAFWPIMVAAFGSPPRKTFDQRAIEPDFSVWGWAFHADPRRALEFLEVRNASKRGFALTGSGTETVVTGRLYNPGRRVIVHGALPAAARADRKGRLRLRVDLGPAHTERQFRAGGSQPSFVTRVVRIDLVG